jgi:hypothetical protein
MERAQVEDLRNTLTEIRAVARGAGLDDCDLADLEEVIAPAEAELRSNLPNVNTLATYLNSVARSLRANPTGRAACMQLDAAMRRANVPTHWEH